MRRDMVNHGYTPGCPGCYAAANDRKHKPHTAVCRERLAKALMDDEKESHRITDARDREDAFLENSIREGDTHIDNNVVKTPREEFTDLLPSRALQRSKRQVRMCPDVASAPVSYEDMLNENNFP